MEPGLGSLLISGDSELKWPELVESWKERSHYVFFVRTDGGIAYSLPDQYPIFYSMYFFLFHIFPQKGILQLKEIQWSAKKLCIFKQPPEECE